MVSTFVGMVNSFPFSIGPDERRSGHRPIPCHTVGVSWVVAASDGRQIRLPHALEIHKVGRHLYPRDGTRQILRGAAQFLMMVHPLRRRIAAEPLRQAAVGAAIRSEEHTSELQSLRHLVCR